VKLTAHIHLAHRLPPLLNVASWRGVQLSMGFNSPWHSTYFSTGITLPVPVPVPVPDIDGSGAHPSSYPVGSGGSFSGENQPGRDAHHSSPPSAEVNMWSYTFIRPYVFMAWCLVKHRTTFPLAGRDDPPTPNYVHQKMCYFIYRVLLL
jgi:hypothetical protein